MCQPVVYKDTARQRKDLSLVLESPEGSGKDKAVIVTLEFCPVFFPQGMQGLLPEAFVGDELFPVHIVKFDAKIGLKIDKDANSSGKCRIFVPKIDHVWK